jgi:outer membrane protein assembly factor BamB
MRSLRPGSSWNSSLLAFAMIAGSVVAPVAASASQDSPEPWISAWSSIGPPFPSVLVADAQGAVAAGYEGALRTFDADGTLLWSARVGGGTLDRLPALEAESVVVATARRITSLDRMTGARRWMRQVSGSRVTIGELHEGRSVLLVSTERGRLQLLDATSGSTLLRARVPGRSPSTAPYIWIESGVGILAWSTPRRCCRIGAVDLRTGAVRWTRWISRHSSVPVVHAGAVVVATGAGSRRAAVARAFDAATGNVRWQTPISGQYGPTLWGDAAGDDVVIADAEGSLHAFDAPTGAVTWVSEEVVASDEAHPTIAGDRVFLTPEQAALVEIDRRSGDVVQSDSLVPGVTVFSSAGSDTLFQVMVGNGLESVVWAYEAASASGSR